MGQQQDYLSMSDEDIMNMPEPDFSNIDTGSEEEDLNTEEDIPEQEEQSPEEYPEPVEEDESDEGEEESPDDDETNSDDESDETVTNNEEVTEEDDESSEDVDNTEESNQYKEQLDKLFSPFKANGKEIKVDSVDEAIQLMQMGANYTKKMTAIKPHLKLVKTMQKHGVSEQDLSFFIDLKSKKPEAIARYLKDAGIDPLDLDLEKSSEYKPQTYTASDQEVELSQTLDELKDLPGHKETLDIVGNKWDNQSQIMLSKHPHAIRTLQEQVADGTYAKVSNEVERRRMLGQLNGLSDLQAYDLVGSEMFGQPQEAPQEPIQQQAPERKVVKRVSSAKKSEAPKNNSRKQAAGLPSSNPKSNNEPDFNPLEMSDEEFEKTLAASQKFI